MADRVAVSNLALSLLGEDDQLTDPNDDTVAARSINAVWDTVRQAVLREGEFNFAIARAELAAAVGEAPYPYDYSYPLPDGFLRLIEVLDPWIERSAYQLEGGAILADDAGPLFIRYVRDVPETGRWDPLFVNAFAQRLAYQIADRITGDRGRKSDCWQGYRAAISKTIGVDAVENPPVVPEEDDWILARVS